MSHASSKPKTIWRREPWKQQMEEPKPCRHEWYGEDGLMWCRNCGRSRIPDPWEEEAAGLPPIMKTAPGDPERLNIRTEGNEGDL